MDGIAASRLSAAELERNFSDIHVPPDRKRALVEASRCNICFDAPCPHCISMVDVTTAKKPISWVQYPSNPLHEPAE